MAFPGKLPARTGDLQSTACRTNRYRYGVHRTIVRFEGPCHTVSRRGEGRTGPERSAHRARSETSAREKVNWRSNHGSHDTSLCRPGGLQGRHGQISPVSVRRGSTSRFRRPPCSSTPPSREWDPASCVGVLSRLRKESRDRRRGQVPRRQPRPTCSSGSWWWRKVLLRSSPRNVDPLKGPLDVKLKGMPGDLSGRAVLPVRVLDAPASP